MTTILTIEKLQEISAISNALANNVELITPFIEFSEIAHLKEDLLGEAMYDQIVGEIEAGTLSGNNETLCTTYLYNLSGWYSYFEALPFIAYRSEAKGLTKKFSDNSQPLDRDEFSEFRQSILDKAIFWRNATIKYLKNNSTLFLLWRSQYYGASSGDECSDNYGGYDNQSGIYL